MKEKEHYSKKEYAFQGLITVAYLMLFLISDCGIEDGFTFYAFMVITLAYGVHTVRVHVWPYFN